MTGSLALLLLAAIGCAGQERARAGAEVRVQRTEIVIPFTPIDEQDHVVANLRPDDVVLYDNGAHRPLTSLLLEDGPASIIFVLDVSSSMRKAVGFIREAVQQVVRDAPRGDEFAVLEFSGEPKVSVDFTSVDQLVKNRVQSLMPSGRTSLVDAAILALQQIRRAHHSRRAIVIITDGQDNHSRHKEREALRAAVETDVRIYSIELYPAVGENYFGKTLLESLAENTGGRYLPTVTAKSIPELVSRIDAHRFYRATFSPVPQEPDGKLHRVEMKLAHKRLVGGKLFWKRRYQSGDAANH